MRSVQAMSRRRLWRLYFNCFYKNFDEELNEDNSHVQERFGFRKKQLHQFLAEFFQKNLTDLWPFLSRESSSRCPQTAPLHKHPRAWSVSIPELSAHRTVGNRNFRKKWQPRAKRVNPSRDRPLFASRNVAPNSVVNWPIRGAPQDEDDNRDEGAWVGTLNSCAQRANGEPHFDTLTIWPGSRALLQYHERLRDVSPSYDSALRLFNFYRHSDRDSCARADKTAEDL